MARIAANTWGDELREAARNQNEIVAYLGAALNRGPLHCRA